MFGYPRLDAGLSISWFLEAMASQKATRHQGLNNRNSGRETIVITIVIVVVRTIQKRQTPAFPIVLAIVLPAQFLLFKIQYPCDFYVKQKDSIRHGLFTHSSHMAMLFGNFCITLVFAFKAQVFMAQNKL